MARMVAAKNWSASCEDLEQAEHAGLENQGGCDDQGSREARWLGIQMSQFSPPERDPW
jgi:hypothetical protein